MKLKSFSRQLKFKLEQLCKNNIYSNKILEKYNSRKILEAVSQRIDGIEQRISQEKNKIENVVTKKKGISIRSTNQPSVTSFKYTPIKSDRSS